MVFHKIGHFTSHKHKTMFWKTHFLLWKRCFYWNVLSEMLFSLMCFVEVVFLSMCFVYQFLKCSCFFLKCCEIWNFNVFLYLGFWAAVLSEVLLFRKIVFCDMCSFKWGGIWNVEMGLCDMFREMPWYWNVFSETCSLKFCCIFCPSGPPYGHNQKYII